MLMVYLSTYFSSIHVEPDEVSIAFNGKMLIDFKVGRTGPIIHYLYFRSGYND